MLFVNAQPTELTAAADNLQVIGSSLAAQNVAAAAPTTGVLSAAVHEVSALTAAQFATHAQDVPGDQRAGRSDPRHVRQHAGRQRRFLRSRRGRERRRNRLRRCTVLDFGALAPEVNSAHMYSGPDWGSCWPPQQPGSRSPKS